MLAGSPKCVRLYDVAQIPLVKVASASLPLSTFSCSPDELVVGHVIRNLVFLWRRGARVRLSCRFRAMTETHLGGEVLWFAHVDVDFIDTVDTLLLVCGWRWDVDVIELGRAACVTSVTASCGCSLTRLWRLGQSVDDTDEKSLTEMLSKILDRCWCTSKVRRGHRQHQQLLFSLGLARCISDEQKKESVRTTLPLPRAAAASLPPL